MDFIINHSGFFFGILMIVLLAVIGYFADKNDKKNADNIKKMLIRLTKKMMLQLFLMNYLVILVLM